MTSLNFHKATGRDFCLPLSADEPDQTQGGAGELSHSTKVDRLVIKVDKVVTGMVFPKPRALSTELFCL